MNAPPKVTRKHATIPTLRSLSPQYAALIDKRNDLWDRVTELREKVSRLAEEARKQGAPGPSTADDQGLRVAAKDAFRQMIACVRPKARALGLRIESYGGECYRCLDVRPDQLIIRPQIPHAVVA